MFSYEEQLARAKERANIRKEKYEIDQINKSYRPKIQTSKVLMAFILINCTVVEIYSMWLMVYLGNLDPLTTLMCSVITESISYAIYCTKSFKETKEQASIQLDRDKFEATINGFPVEEPIEQPQEPEDSSFVEVPEDPDYK